MTVPWVWAIPLNGAAEVVFGRSASRLPPQAIAASVNFIIMANLP
jgi:hypothetical protein